MENKLFDIGLSLISDFISKEEEIMLGLIVHQSVVNKTNGRNTIRRYGSNLPYRTNVVSDEIPTYFDFLLDRLVENKLMPFRPDSVTINEYLKGQGVAPHIDTPESGCVIGVLSLVSEAEMLFLKKREKIPVALPTRSLLRMKDEVRYNWKHCIKPVKNKRYSIVFRCSTNLK